MNPMRTITLDLDERYFNLLWRSLDDRDKTLMSVIEQDEESDEAALAGNDLVYLRLCKADLEQLAKNARFSDGAFALSQDVVDLMSLTKPK